MKNLFSLLGLLLSSIVFAQTSPATYPANSKPETEYAMRLDNLFPELNVGILHVYALDDSEIDDTYLLEGNEIPERFHQALPKKFNRMARKGNAYAAAALAGYGENLYLIRFTDTRRGERIDLFERDGEKLMYIKNMAAYQCRSKGCMQTDGYLADFDGNGVFDIALRTRLTDSSGNAVNTTDQYFNLIEDNILIPTTEVSDVLENTIELHQMSRK